MSEPSPEVQRASDGGTILVRPIHRRAWFLLWGLLSALLMAVGSVGPWVGAGRFDLSGGIQYGDVWLVLVAAIVGAVVLIVWSHRRTAGVAALLAGLVGLAVALYDRWHLVRLISLPPGVHFFTAGFLQVGWGFYFALLASFSFALCGLVWLLAHADSPESSEPASATPAAD